MPKAPQRFFAASIGELGEQVFKNRASMGNRCQQRHRHANLTPVQEGIMRRFWGMVLGLVFIASGALAQVTAQGAAQGAAQDAVPQFRYLMSRDTDFFGADLDALFDTNLQICARTCTGNDQCSAFTFNTEKNACFPKSRVSERIPFQGALSAEKIATDPAVLRRAPARRDDLGFLGENDISRAVTQARDLGLTYPAGGRDLGTILSIVRDRRDSGNKVDEMGWTAVAVSLTDRADPWLEYARLLLAIQSGNADTGRDYRFRAISAAVNGYLRAENTAVQVAALMTLSRALERNARGRDMIGALRLARSLMPRDDIAAELERAVGKYGFRIAGNSVESDSAAPRICVEFTEPLVKAGVDYDSYVRLPDPALLVQADGSRLCIDGVQHGNRYRVTFRQGLPAASGETLFKDVEIIQYVRDRSPSVRFPGRSYVLPRAADAALPVQTVNATRLDLRLRRISERNLLRAVQDGFFGRPLSQWQDRQFASEIAEEVWTGSAEVASEINRDMTSRLPMGAAIAGLPAGIYALSARIPGADPYEDAGATQWFVLSDLGISTMSGVDGLHVTLRGLSDAEPRANVDVTLVSRANAVLARAVTDETGYARFEPGLMRGTGGAAPALLLAELNGADVGFLSLTDPAFDLSDRGVEGRAPAGPVDVFLSTDRGAYRAGETIFATVLARDASARAIEGLPLIAILSRPDGVEYRRRLSDGGNAGGHVFAIPVGADVPRGTWRLDIKSDPEAAALASQTILVEDFLPERIDFDLSLPDTPINAYDSPPLRIDARYLFGAPGADLTIEGEVTLRGATTVAGWPGYRFGRYDARGSARTEYFADARTDAGGQATVGLTLPEPDAPNQPLEATVTVRLSDGSARPVERRVTAPVRPDAAIIGIRPLFEDEVGEGSDAAFEVIGLTPDLTPMPMRVRWTLNRVQTRYQWYQLYGDWNWEPTTRRTRIASGEADLGAVPLALSQGVEWGRYELVVERLGGDYTAAAVDFYAGWYVPADSSATPDRLELSLDRPSYRAGDTARLRIVPRMAGTALISVMSNRLIERLEIPVDAGETVIPLPVTEDWGTGVYVTAAVIRPMDVAAGQNPARALGLVHASVQPTGRQLAVSIDVPEVAGPRQTQRARLRVAGARAGEDVWVTLAAVDLGILNLTAFQSPDPSGYYFGQQRLGMELRDVYGRLIDGMNGAMGVVRSGGDAAAGMRMQSPPPTQELMASFSGPVQVGADGTALVDIDLPAFNGTVRLMAVAWSKSAVGQAERDMLVRDPVVVTASVPRFLAPGDTARIRLEVVHADGPAGAVRLTLLPSSGALRLGSSPDRFTLAKGGKAVFDVAVQALSVGDPTFDVILATPDGRILKQTLTLPVRANDPEVARTRRFSLAAGDGFAFSDDVFTGLRAGTGRAVLSAGPLATFDAPGLLSMLDRYPYGCTEQITSQAMPLLYLSSVAQATGLGDGPAVRKRVDAAIARILTRQDASGAFGLWRAESGYFWLDAYASDFLSRARARGFAVPDQAFRLAMDNLRNRINYAADFDEGGGDIAYALMVLAREGAAAMGDLRYYADEKAAAFDTPMAAAQLGAALASYGDQTRADAMFARAAAMINGAAADPQLWRADFGSDLRDVAGVLTLATEAGSRAIDTARLTARIGRATARMSTQEAAWTLMAAQALIKSPEQSGLRVNGAAVSGPFVQVRQAGSGGGLTITAATGQATEITLTTIGVPQIPPAAGGTGYGITRSYYTMEGAPIESPAFAVGDRFVTVLRINRYQPLEGRLMVDDPLPAGIEIDNPSLLRSGDVRALDWLKPSAATYTEFRADRFLAAIDMRRDGPVTLAYVARAVTPGVFHSPAASVEDMYRPRYRARTDTGRLTIRE
jgi:alpha-2-macroglobulin